MQSDQAASPDLALSYLDLLESLSLSLDFLAFEATQDKADILTALQDLFGDLPQPEHYQFCAQLKAEQLSRIEAEWQASALLSGQLISQADLALSQRQIAGLHHAAGEEL